MKILSVSDVEVSFIYSPHVTERYKDIDLVLSCGDLPYYYLEYIVTMLNVPLYYVRGNHARRVELGVDGDRTEPWGAVDLHGRTAVYNGLLLAGIQGSLRYNQGPYQYTQDEMWALVFSLVPGLLWNRLRYGRFLDVFISHAPPAGIHDQSDLPHRGFHAFRWLIKMFKPAIHFHGHIHLYAHNAVTETPFIQTRVINTYGYRETEFTVPPGRATSPQRSRDQGERVRRL